MRVIPSINCPDVESVKLRIETVKTFLAPGELLHLDVTDGIFTGHAVWADPVAWKDLRGPFGLEVHLMVEHPEEHLEGWIAAGLRRCVIHVETITRSSFQEIFDRCSADGVEIMLSSDPETPLEDMASYRARVSGFHVLAVHPGAAGQEFMPEALEKIRSIREGMQDAIIEVDGGINPQTAALTHAAGADTVISATYIFGSADPKKSYEELARI
jgi:ribulose-phosphate 3-epimerase